MPNRHITFLFNYGGVHDLYRVKHMYMYMCVIDVNNRWCVHFKYNCHYKVDCVQISHTCSYLTCSDSPVPLFDLRSHCRESQNWTHLVILD